MLAHIMEVPESGKDAGGSDMGSSSMERKLGQELQRTVSISLAHF